ncbi:MAG: sulfite exporter TauE/SafE family protein [gamma proteobacterium symbiont of Bathyaustriella thionipta]|nr:sulfite exporter TauE/SafE family protein [gamma proteobacterium symbiont of Bathyaustriella thionipta]
MLETLTNGQLISSFAIIIIAFTVRGITGFGSGLIAIPLLALMLPITVVVPLAGVLDYVAALAHGLKLRSEIRWQVILPLLPFSLLGVLLALYLFNTVDAQLLKHFLGGFIIIYALYTLLTIKPKTHSSLFWAIPGGTLGCLIVSA